MSASMFGWGCEGLDVRLWALPSLGLICDLHKSALQTTVKAEKAMLEGLTGCASTSRVCIRTHKMLGSGILSACKVTLRSSYQT